MDPEQYKRYIAEQNSLFLRMQEIQTEAEKAPEWSAEQRTNWDAANDRITEVSAKIEEHQADEARAARMAELDSVDYSQVVDTRGAAGGDGGGDTAERRDEQRQKVYDDAFGQFVRHGMSPLNAEQRNALMATETRAQSIGTNTAGGYLVPPGFLHKMTTTMKAFGGLLNLANVIHTTTGNPLQWPSFDDTGNVGAILTENTQISQQDVAIGTKNIGAYVYTSKAVLVSLQLLQDSAFDIDTWLPEQLGIRIGRAVSAHLISGTGSGQPEGIATNVTAGKTGTTGQTLTVTYDDLIDLEHSLDPAYRNGNCRFVMNDASLKVIRKLKDSQNRPLWVPVPTPGMAATINGWEYVIDQGMPVMAANAKSILFGDFKRGFLVRQVNDVQMVRLAERYADYLQVGFFGYSRLDAKPDDTNAVKAYVNSAT